jgi:DNA-binding winged helix-turn-helix (wHTH) protein
MQPSTPGGNPGAKSRFGVFEFDPQVRELTKHGVRLKLQEQPIQILAALLEQAGQIVPREDLQRRLWPGGTFVDYEQSLNKAVNKLREALGDSAAKPIYIETLARRGYRFVAPVKVDRPSSETTQAALPSALQLAPAPQRRTRLTWAAVAGACAAGVGTALLWLTRPPPPPRVTGTTQITNDGRPKTSPLLTDGARLFFNVAFGDYEGYQVSVKGGEPVALSLSVKNARLEDVSPDRTELLVCESPTAVPPCPLRSVPLLGGSARRLGNLLARRGSAAWSPDGQQVVYARGKELHIARRDGTEVRKLATVAGDPAWVR